MNLEQFSKTKKTDTFDTSPVDNPIANFAKGEESYVQETKSTLDNVKSNAGTVWDWTSKQLMKPIGMVAAETEQLGKLIGTGKKYMPGKEALSVLTGNREYSFTDLWSEYGTKAGISEPVATGIGFVTDLVADPFNFIGGGLTKVGKLANKVTSITKAGTKIEKGSKIAKEIEASGRTIKELQLAGSRLEQSQQGQRAMLQVLNKTVVKGEKYYEATDKFGKIVKGTKPAQSIAKMFSTKTGNKTLDDMVSGFNNLTNYRKEVVLDKAGVIQKDINKLKTEEVKQVIEIIENPDIAITVKDKNITDIASNLESLFKDMKVKEKDVGVLKTELDSYFPHIKNKEGLSDRIKYLFNPKKYATVLKSSKGRKLEGTVAEINEKFGKEFFQSNPAIAYAERGIASAKATTAKEFLDEAGKKFFVNAEDAPISYVESKNPLFKGLSAPKEVTEAVDKYIVGLKPDELKNVVRAFDGVQNWWKSQALISPSYHTRNMVGNFWNNWLGGVKNPVVYSDARKVQLGKKVSMRTATGAILDEKQILQGAKEQNVVGRGWYSSDINQAIKDEVGTWKESASKIEGYNPFAQDNVAFKLNKAVGSAVEDNARLAHYIDKLKKGYSSEAAAQSVKKYLFDYGDLTDFEKQIMKRTVPFYTWTRKNIPLQLENLIVQPEKFSAIPKVIDLIEKGTAEPESEKYMSDYMKSNVPVRVRTNSEGNSEYFLLGNWLPAAQAIDFMSQPLDNIINMVTPLAKTPFELWANKSLFFKNTLGENSKIENYYKQPTELMNIPMRKKTAILLRNVRVFNDINKIIKTPSKDEPENTVFVKAMDLLFGKAATYDEGLSRRFYELDTKNRMSEYKSSIKKALRAENDEYADELIKEMNNFIKERNE